MASLGELFVSIRPDTKGFGPELSKGLNALMPIANASGANLGKGLAGGLGKAGVAGAVIAVGAAIVSVGNEFDTQYRRISASTGAVGDQLKGLEGSFKNVAKNTSASFTDIGTALIEVQKRTGLTGAGLETMTRQFLGLSKMTGGDVKTNIESATRAFGAWGVSVKDQSPKLDELFKLNQKTGVSVGTLETQLQRFSAPLRQFGFGFDEAAVMLAKWQKEGVNTDTALAGLRLAIRNTTLEAGRVKLSKDLGFTISKDPKTALEQLSTAIRNAKTDSAATKIAIDAFGSRAGPELAKDIRTGKMSYDDLMKSVQGSKDTILDSAKRNATLGSSFEKLKNQIKVALEPMAVPAMEGLRKVMDALAPVVVKLVEAWRKLSPIILVLMPGIIGFRVALMALSPILDGFNWLIDKVSKGISAAIGWFKDFPKHISQAGSAIADFFTKLPGRIVDFFTALPGRIVSFFTKLPGWIAQGIGELGHIGKTIIDKVVSGITTAASAIWDFFKQLPEHIAQALGFVVGTLVKAGATIISKMVDGIVTAASAIWDFFKNLPGRIVSAAGAVGTWLLNTGKTILTGLWHGLEAGSSAVWDYLKKLPGRFVSGLGNIGSWLLDAGKKVIGGLARGITEGPGAIWDFFKKLPGRITGAISGAGKWLLNVGKDIIGGLFSGIGNAVKSVGSWINDHIFQPFIHGILSAFGISSPAKKLIDVGKNIIEGLLKGITSVVGKVFDFFTGLPGKIIRAVGNVARTLWDKGKDLLDGLWNGIKDVVAAVVDYFTNLPGRFVRGLGNIARTLWDKGKELLQGLWDGIKDVAGGIVDYFTHLPGRFIDGLGNIARTLWDTGKKLIEGLYNGIKDALGNIGDWVNEHIVKPVKDAVTGLFDIFSPSKVFYGYGQNLMQGMQDGIDKHKGPVEAVQRMGKAMMVAVKPITLPVQAGPAATLPAMPAAATTAAATAAATVARPVAAAAMSPGPSAPKAVAGPNLTVAVKAETKDLDAAVKASAGQLAKLPKAVAIPITAPGVQQTTGLLTVFNRTTGTGQTSVTGLRQAVEKVPAPTAAAGAALGRTSQDLVRFSGRTDTATTDVVGFGDQVRLRPGELAALGASLGHGGDALRGYGTRTDGAAATVVGFGGQVRLRPGELAALGTSLGAGGGALDTFRGKTDTGSGAVETFGGKLRDAPGNLQIMQHALDIMHGKAFDVTATAKVNQPDWKALIEEARKQLAAAGGAFATGGIHGASLPRDAVIAPAQPGGGLVQWAEPGTGGEAFIPLASDRRERSLEVWRRTGKLLGAFAVGGLLDPDLKLLTGQWQPGIDATATAANEFTRATGQDFADRSAAAAGKDFTVAAIKYLFEQQAAAAGGGGTGGGLANAEAVVALARSMLGHPYQPPYYDPSGFSCDGLVWWVFNQFGINTGRNAEYQIHNAQQVSEAESKPGDVVAFKHVWNPEMIPGSTYGHIGIVSGPDRTVNALGHAYGVVESSIRGLTSIGRTFGRFLKNLNPGYVPGGGGAVGTPGNYATYAGYLGMHWTQAALEAAVRKEGGDANMAHVLGAIAMAEAMPIGKFIGNPTGMYTGAWAFQQSWAARMYDWNRLSNDLDYDAKAAINLWNAPGPGGSGPTHMKWETWPGAASRFLDEGGWLPPGASLAINQTGQHERVIGPATDDALVTELRALPRKVGRAVADALNGVASYATMQV